MNSSMLYTKRFLGLDINVWLPMLACIVFSLGLVGYRSLKNPQEETCAAIDIFVNGRTSIENIAFDPNVPLTFRAPALVRDEVKWDFGDGQDLQPGTSMIHVFASPGRYTVRAIVNNRCEYKKDVLIKDPGIIYRDSKGNIIVPIVSDNSGKVGEEISFHTTLEAARYDWYIDNNPNYPIQQGNIVNFKFNSQNTYTVVLVLDQDNTKKFTKQIIISEDKVNPAAGPQVIGQLIKVERIIKDTPVVVSPKDTVVIPKPAPKTTKIISDEIFRSYMQSLICKELQLDFFDQFLCEGSNTPVVINKSERKTLAKFYEEVIKKKRIEIESVVAGRNENQCVVMLSIQYDKKSRLSRPCKTRN